MTLLLSLSMTLFCHCHVDDIVVVAAINKVVETTINKIAVCCCFVDVSVVNCNLDCLLQAVILDNLD